MTPQLQQAIRLLQLPVLELQAQIREALESNVMLEAEDESGSLETGESALEPAINPTDALSLTGVTCLAVGCTTLGQIEDDVRIAKEFKAFTDTELTAMRKRAERLGGPRTEDWKVNTEKAEALIQRDGRVWRRP